DAPGFIGRLGSALGEADINIGTFHLGRRHAGGEAILLLSLDAQARDSLVDTVKALPGVKRAMSLRF
ncbi:MAG: ACT domain-containing protein, partial [Alphaproteobacteria bacterium]